MLTFIVISLQSCTKREGERVPQIIHLALDAKYQNATDGSSAITDETITTSIIYVCENAIVKQIYKSTTADPGKFVIKESSLNSRSRLYAISNYHLIPEIESITIGDSQVVLEALSAAHSANPQELIMGAVTDVALVGSSSMDVDMVRNAARFDVGIKGTGVEIHSISVSGLAQKGSIFSGILPVDNAYTAKFEALYSTPLTSDVDGLFYAYELPADKQALITAKVGYNGTLADLKIPVTQIRRNHLYKIVFSSIGSIVTAEIDLSGMVDGDVDDAETDRVAIKIDPTNSTIPSGAEVSAENQRLTLPYAGATATIALTGDFDKQYSIDGAIDGLVITSETGTTYQNSRLTITVPANTRMGGNNQAALIRVSRKGETNPTKFDRIAIVGTNFAPFEIVTVAGIDWCAINAISANTNDYPTLQAGQTMKELYAQNWLKYCTSGRMWGRRPGHATYGQIRLDPWQSLYWMYDGAFNYNNLSGSNGDIIGSNAIVEWTDPNTTLCPVGWRVAKREEFLKIWPTIGHDFDAIPSLTYSPSTGGSFTATIESSGRFNYPGASGDGKNLVITDNTSGASVRFPIGGWRNERSVHSNNSYDGYGMEVAKTVYYWCYERYTPDLNYARTVGLENLKSRDGHKPANCFLTVRCVRDTK